MRVFVTGATGFIGSAIVQELRAAGHEVLGLARSDAAADTLARLAVEVHRGDLSDLDGLAAAARACDGVIHTAFNHDWSVAREVAAETDQRAVEAMAGALEGSGKPFVVTSGTLMLAMVAPGRTGTEDDAPASVAIPRAASELAVQAAAGRGVRASPPCTGSTPRGSFDSRSRRQRPARACMAPPKKACPYARSPSRSAKGLAFKSGASPPTRHRRISAFWRPLSPLDNPTSSAITRESVGWRPRQPELLIDMRDNGYFSDR